MKKGLGLNKREADLDLVGAHRHAGGTAGGVGGREQMIEEAESIKETLEAFPEDA